MEAIDLDKGVLRGAQNRLKDSFVEAPQASAIGAEEATNKVSD
jgi:hypothetical protein